MKTTEQLLVQIIRGGTAPIYTKRDLKAALKIQESENGFYIAERGDRGMALTYTRVLHLGGHPHGYLNAQQITFLAKAL